MDTIVIKGLAVKAIIGVYTQERERKQKLTIDIKLQYDSSQAVAADNIKYALDYHKITTDIHAFVSQSSFELLETLAHRIATKILQITIVQKVELTIWKPEALKQANNVGISISKSK
ncbi:MAG: dihydroneopterin aldolase [Proteobacteria bacterium]|nr:dihydroneopterin aldolase [Pseudomonadota bacterium]